MDRLIIGEVLKPQGIRGELKVKTFTDFPDDVKAFGTVYIDDKPYKILSFRVGNDGAAYIGPYKSSYYVKSAVEEAKKVLNDADADKDKFEEATKQLSDKIMPIGAKLYQAASEDSKSDDKKSDDSKSDDEPVEGEVVDKQSKQQ